MAVTVSIPTILRTHTGGEKSVSATGTTLAEVIDDLENNHGGLKALRAVRGEQQRSYLQRIGRCRWYHDLLPASG